MATTRVGAGPVARRAPSSWWAALAGVVSAAVGLAVAELLAAFVAPASSPVLAAGSAVVDAVPGWLKDAAVVLFGTGDKAALFVTMGLVLLAGAALAGVLEAQRPPWGAVLLAAVGVVAAVVATLRPGASPTWAVPSVIGIGAAVPLLRALVARVPDAVTARAHRAVGSGAGATGAAPRTAVRPGPAPSGGDEGQRGAGAQRAEDAAEPAPSGGAGTSQAGATTEAALDRRRFLQLSGLAAVGAVVAVAASRVVGAGARTVDAVRSALRLPAPVTAALAVPAGAELGIDGLAPYITPNEVFYRIDTALRVPVVDPETWSLRVDGLVDAPFELTWDELLALPLVEHHVTLACVSNFVGGDLVGNALWLGYPVRELLARARPQVGADMVLSRSIDGFTAGTPLDVLLDPDRDCLLAIGMNGEPLPTEHGFPARLVVPGLYGYVSATKWVTELKVTRFADDVAYWTPRGWSELGPVKLQSRIDVPRHRATVTAADGGTVVVAGVAWAQHTGIRGVEVRVDDGPWEPATLADTVGPDTWRQWHYAWDAAAAGIGDHALRVRATDADGQVQTGEEAPPAPDGATGWHEISVSVR